MTNDVIIQGDIQFTRSDHSYVHLPSGKKLASVSSIIKKVYNAKSWDGVAEDVIDNARVRGLIVDKYMSEYINTGVVEMPEGERQDVVDRVVIAHRLLEANYGDRIEAQVQHIVYNEDFGIAGTPDFIIDGEVVDLKVTYSPEVDWALQIGAYAFMGGCKKASIIHVSPSFYKTSGGGRLITYDVEQCKRWWFMAREWWEETTRMESAAKKNKTVRS